MPKKVIILHIVLIISSFFGLNGCTDNPNVKDLSSLDLSMNVLRFEQELFACKSVSDITTLAMKYPDFYNTYTHDIIGYNVRGPKSTEEDIAVELYKYIAHKDMNSLFGKTQEKFEDFDAIQDELEEAAKYINFYFPQEKIENITTFISTFHYGSVYDALDKRFLIGVDLYLGGDYEVYQAIDPQNFPTYRIKKFEPYRIVPNCVQTFTNHIVPSYEGTNFIEQAIYEGKKLYLLDLLIPSYHDSLKMNYLQGQTEWVIDQEKNIWSYLVQEEVLYSSDKNNFQKHYFNDGPFTTPFGNESSPRAGAWIGWQIVKMYMKQNTEITIHELLADNNHQAIFQKSGYRP
ncbi:hypothetical protein N8368_02700 [Bacteroidia bacterium]|nr:hypothetical protein [Bacteroidia bacterium]MDC1395397.1 hypothetical protein [Bacteroidia bacterium]